LPAKSKHQPLEKNALHPPRGENATTGGLLLLLLLPLSFISAVQECTLLRAVGVEFSAVVQILQPILLIQLCLWMEGGGQNPISFSLSLPEYQMRCTDRKLFLVGCGRVLCCLFISKLLMVVT
jgi:hypothetical protein